MFPYLIISGWGPPHPSHCLCCLCIRTAPVPHAAASSRTLYQYIPNLYQHHTIGYAAAPLANLLTSAARETPTAVHCLGSHQILSAGRREN